MSSCSQVQLCKQYQDQDAVPPNLHQQVPAALKLAHGEVVQRQLQRDQAVMQRLVPLDACDRLQRRLSRGQQRLSGGQQKLGSQYRCITKTVQAAQPARAITNIEVVGKQLA